MTTPAVVPSQVAIIRSIDTLVFDAVLTEEHTSELAVTTNPIETGAPIADHCFMQPLKITISAVVSDLKMPTAPATYSSGGSRTRRAFEMLQAQQTDMASGKAIPFSVSTGLRLYEQMVCISLSAKQDAESAQLLEFEAQLQEVITVETQSASYTKPAPGKTARQATPTVKKGDEQAKQPDEQVTSMMEAIGEGLSHPQEAVKKVVSGLGGLLGK